MRNKCIAIYDFLIPIRHSYIRHAYTACMPIRHAYGMHVYSMSTACLRHVYGMPTAFLAACLNNDFKMHILATSGPILIKPKQNLIKPK